MSQDPLVQKILLIIRELSKIYYEETFLVGGFIRDLLLGKEATDLDFLLDPFNYDFLQKLSHIFKGKLVTLDDERKYYRIVIEKDKRTYNLDFTPIYQKNLFLELSRRDFTINSIALNLKDFQIIDPLNGIKDLSQNILKMSSPLSFKEDPLRILRAFRFIGAGFKIEEKTLENMKRERKRLKNVKPERIHEEIYKILRNPFTKDIWEKMEETSALEILFPELIELQKIPWSNPHHEDAFQHSLSTLSALEFLYFHLENLFPDLNDKIKLYLEEKIFSEYSKKEALKLMALFHDIGKIKTFSIDEKGLVHYYRHSEQGAIIIQDIGERLRFSNKEITFYQKLIQHHMYLINFLQNLNNLSMYKLINRVQEDTPGLVLLFTADQLAIKGEKSILDFAKKLLKEFFDIKNLPKPLLNGKEIMKIFNLKQSPLVGELKEKLIEAQVKNLIKTREEAINYLKGILKDETSSQ